MRPNALWLLPLGCWSALAFAQQPSIFYAAMANDIGVAKQYVASGAPVDVKDKFGRTPLMLAAEHGNTKLVEYLLRSGANPDLKVDTGLRAIDFARQPEIVNLLAHARDNKSESTNHGH
jgi:uncharacterized protein